MKNNHGRVREMFDIALLTGIAIALAVAVIPSARAQDASHVAGAIEYGVTTQPITFQAYTSNRGAHQPPHDQVNAVCMGSDPRACRPGEAFCNIDVVGFRECLSQYADRIVKQPGDKATVIVVEGQP